MTLCIMVRGFFQVIQGYELGVPGMCLGEIRTLTIPPHLAYGDQGVAGVIPGGSTLQIGRAHV